jgi:hypothetical protein
MTNTSASLMGHIHLSDCSFVVIFPNIKFIIFFIHIYNNLVFPKAKKAMFKKQKLLILLAIVSFNNLFAQLQKSPDSLQSKIIIIGDAGGLIKGRQPVVDAVRENFVLDEKTVIIYLGDNLYHNGLPDEASSDYDALRAIIDSQVVIAKGTKAKVYFIPGNHDWDYGLSEGWERIVRQQQYIDRTGGGNVSFYPKGGCPGRLQPKAIRHSFFLKVHVNVSRVCKENLSNFWVSNKNQFVHALCAQD